MIPWKQSFHQFCHSEFHLCHNLVLFTQLFVFFVGCLSSVYPCLLGVKSIRLKVFISSVFSTCVFLCFYEIDHGTIYKSYRYTCGLLIFSGVFLLFSLSISFSATIGYKWYRHCHCSVAMLQPETLGLLVWNFESSERPGKVNEITAKTM